MVHLPSPRTFNFKLAILSVPWRLGGVRLRFFIPFFSSPLPRTSFRVFHLRASRPLFTKMTEFFLGNGLLVKECFLLKRFLPSRLFASRVYGSSPHSPLGVGQIAVWEKVTDCPRTVCMEKDKCSLDCRCENVRREHAKASFAQRRHSAGRPRSCWKKKRRRGRSVERSEIRARVKVREILGEKKQLSNGASSSLAPSLALGDDGVISSRLPPFVITRSTCRI